MPTKRLPARPDLEHLKNQAKDLRTDHRVGKLHAFQRIREFHPRSSSATDADIRSAALSRASTPRENRGRGVPASCGLPHWLATRTSFDCWSSEAQDSTLKTFTTKGRPWNGSSIWWLSKLATAPSHRGRGFGALAVRKAIDALAGQGADRLYLDCVLGRGFLVDFYRGFGFQTIGRRAVQFSTGRIPRIQIDGVARLSEGKFERSFGRVGPAVKDLPDSHFRQARPRRGESRFEHGGPLEQDPRLFEILARELVEGRQGTLVEAPCLEVLRCAVLDARMLGELQIDDEGGRDRLADLVLHGPSRPSRQSSVEADSEILPCRDLPPYATSLGSARSILWRSLPRTCVTLSQGFPRDPSGGSTLAAPDPSGC